MDEIKQERKNYPEAQTGYIWERVSRFKSLTVHWSMLDKPFFVKKLDRYKRVINELNNLLLNSGDEASEIAYMYIHSSSLYTYIVGHFKSQSMRVFAFALRSMQRTNWNLERMGDPAYIWLAKKSWEERSTLMLFLVVITKVLHTRYGKFGLIKSKLLSTTRDSIIWNWRSSKHMGSMQLEVIPMKQKRASPEKLLQK